MHLLYEIGEKNENLACAIHCLVPDHLNSNNSRKSEYQIYVYLYLINSKLENCQKECFCVQKCSYVYIEQNVIR